jgi:methylmalonyl-CoA mutase N-terminal domain/subunit
VIFEESGVASVADPLGGSWFIEKLTDQMEEAAFAYIRKIDELGGIVRAIEEGYPQREIANSAYQFQRQVDAGERSIVGVNKHVTDGDEPIPTLKIDYAAERKQIEFVREVRAKRDARRATEALEAVRRAAASDDNLMYPILEAVRAHVTLGEISDVFRRVYGEHRDPAYL